MTIRSIRAANRRGRTAFATALAAPLAAALIFPGVALAETPAEAEGDPQRSDIIVTGHREADANPNAEEGAPYKVNRSTNDRFTEELRDTPKSVTVIPKEVIEDIGATSFREVVRATPGVTLGTGEGGNAFGDRIFIRGFEARNDVYIDGLRDPGVTSREIFAVEQIEIVKGPSGAYGGRGTTGGLVSVQSKRPSFIDSFAVVDAGIGTDNFYRATADLNYVVGDRFALRVNGLYMNADTPGRDHVTQERYGGTVAATAHLTDTLSVTGDYYLLRLDGLPDFGVPFSADPAIQRPADVDRENYYGITDRDFLKNEADVATLRLDWDPIPELRFRSVTRYGKTANRYVVGAPESPCRFARTGTGGCPTTGIVLPEDEWTVRSNPKNSNRDNRYWANITDVTADIALGGIEQTLVLGGEWSDETIENRPFSFDSINIAPPGQPPVYVSSAGVTLNYLDPNPETRFDAALTEGPLTSVTVKNLSAYLIDTIKFSEAVQLLLGARYDSYALDWRTENPTATVRELDYDAGFWNWQASLLVKPVEALSLYASYATSTNPSGEQIDGNGASYDGISAQTVNLEPERNKAYEIGAKYEVGGGKLLLTAALFRIDKDNARENIGGGLYDTVGRLRSEGVELSVQGTLFDRIQLFGGYSYTDATIIESNNPANVGARFANIPQHSGSLLATVYVTEKFEIGGQVYAQDEIFGGSSAAGTAMVPGYVRFDAVAKYRFNDRLELRANVVNIADRTYYDAIYRSGTPFAYIAPGRSATLTLTGTF